MNGSTVLAGAIHTIFREEKYGDFIKRVFWIKEVNVKNPQYFALEMWHDDVNVLNKFRLSEEVECQVELKGRLWQKNGRDMIITTLRCTGIKHV